jgi:tetratricopeptide (TPR) repeat protein
MKGNKTQFDPEQENQPSAESVDADSVTGAVQSFNSNETTGLETDAPIYRNDPNFQMLLVSFQNAEWENCLEKLSQLLSAYPEDKSLLAFKQDVELRITRQQNLQKQQTEENRIQRQKTALRATTITAAIVVLVIFLIWAGSIYQANVKQARINQEATLTAQSLAAKNQTADTFMKAGKPEEALSLYNEIQQADPSYSGIDQKIQSANQSITVENLYQQGLQSIKNGNNDQALATLQQVDALHPKYKDTPQLIQSIQQQQQVASLVADIHSAYAQGNSAGVIHDYEAIQAIDPSFQMPELNEILFNSYENLIVDIASNKDATLSDIETANNYYRNALALSPQTQDYAKKRDELQKIASGLLANKYYLQGIDLLKSSNYSIDGAQQAIIILMKASNNGSDSPVIQAEIEKAKLFAASYNSLLQSKWDASITGFELLHRREENYASGRVKYFLYESYIARGDLLFANADFQGAFSDYQEAEKYAWGDEGNLLRLFQIETRIGAVLNRLGRAKESAQFYNYIFGRLNYQSRLTNPDEADLLNTLTQADLAFKNGDDAGAVRLYETAMKQKQKFYSYKTVSANQGDTLANIAFENGTTLEGLRNANQFGESTTITTDQEISIPVIAAIGQ